MDWLVVTVLGACGGAVVQLVDLAVSAREWQKARHEALAERRVPMPRLAAYVDVPADSLVFLTRLALGAVAGFIFHGQVDGATAAVAVGASAPALLRQLGALHNPGDPGARTDEGTVFKVAASKEMTDVTPIPAEEG